MKHWRQDWSYNARFRASFNGNGNFSTKKVSGAKGKWLQTVYHVDDSPRYAGLGKWVHYPEMSVWESFETWRPLPRREASIRSDYQALIGMNRHTILADGWTHEQDNLKTVLKALSQVKTHIAREIGLNRYQRIKKFDFSAGDSYWKNTKSFWSDVRVYWKNVFKKTL